LAPETKYVDGSPAIPATTETRPALFVGPSDRHGRCPSRASSREAAGVEDVGADVVACARTDGEAATTSPAAAHVMRERIGVGFVTEVIVALPNPVHNAATLATSLTIRNDESPAASCIWVARRAEVAEHLSRPGDDLHSILNSHLRRCESIVWRLVLGTRGPSRQASDHCASPGRY